MSPIERATAAIIADLRRQAETTGCEVDDDGSSAQVDGSFEVAPLVRAVLGAIRQPSENMLAVDPAGPAGVVYPEDLWRSMVDAAIDEG